MGNKDVISKSVLCHLTADIANLLLGLGVDANSVELLDTERLQHPVGARHPRRTGAGNPV